MLTGWRNRAGAAGVGAVYGLGAGLLPILIALRYDPDTTRAARALLVLAASGTGAALGVARAARRPPVSPAPQRQGKHSHACMAVVIGAGLGAPMGSPPPGGGPSPAVPANGRSIF